MMKPAFLLTNEQRVCLGLELVEPAWEWVKLKSSPYDQDRDTWACFDGGIIRKAVTVGPGIYTESSFREETAGERTLLLPRTAKGKPKKLSAVTLLERKPRGMYLRWEARFSGVTLGNADTERTYYSSRWEPSGLDELEGFCAWLDRWVRETTPEDLAELSVFSAAKRTHVQYREGDFFRFKVGRRQYGYGRVLLDYYKLKKAQPCWDIVMCRPLVVKVYHLITEESSVPVERLRGLPALPSQYLMDNDLYYGGFTLCGHLPLEEEELDYPIMYGGSISALDAGKGKVYLQCGRLFRELEDAAVLPGCHAFRNNSVGGLHMDRPLWESCIAAGDNAPLWKWQAERDRRIEALLAEGRTYALNRDLRNPAYRQQLEAVCRQFGLQAQDLRIC